MTGDSKAGIEKSTYVVFGVSNMFSDFVDCVDALGSVVSQVVLNQNEVMHSNTLSLQDRLKRLGISPKVCRLEDFSKGDSEKYIVGVTTPAKKRLVEQLDSSFDIQLNTIIHPTAYVSPFAQIGNGVYIGANSVIGPLVIIRDNVFINRAVTVGHDTEIGEYSRLMPGVNVAGHIVIGKRTTVGMGVSVIEKTVIGDDVVIGAGAVVINDFPDSVLVVGVPAMVKKSLTLMKT